MGHSSHRTLIPIDKYLMFRVSSDSKADIIRLALFLHITDESAIPLQWPKLGQDVTHEKRLGKDSEIDMKMFYEGMEPLGEKLACILFNYRPRLPKRKDSRN